VKSAKYSKHIEVRWQTVRGLVLIAEILACSSYFLTYLRKFLPGIQYVTIATQTHQPEELAGHGIEAKITVAAK